MAASYVVKETDGTSKFTLEDSSGAMLLEISTASGGGAASTAITSQPTTQILLVNDVL